MQLLAVACRLVLSAQAPGAAQAQPQLLLCSHAAAGGEQAATVLQQAQQLVALCLAGLAFHAPQLAAQLQQPRLGATAAAAPSSSPAAPILEALLLLTDTDSWKVALGPAAAAEATAQILAAAVSGGLFGQLAAVAAAACPEDSVAAGGGPVAGPAAAASRQPVAGGEALVTALTVRYLSQQQAVARRLAQRQQRRQQQAAGELDQQQQQAALQASSQQQLADSAEQQLPLLLCVPLLLRRLPTLQPVAGRLWRHTVAALHALPPKQLGVWLQPGHDQALGVAAAAGAALLGNLLEGTAAALKAEDAQQLAAAWQPAQQFAALASTLLALLPLEPFFPSGASSGSGGAGGSSRWVEEEDENEEQAVARAAAAAAAAVQTPRLPWDAEQLPSASLVAQMQLVSDGGMLRALVRALLPLASAQQQTAPALAQCVADARRLCALLQQLLALPGQRQRLLVMLAFSADLVQRLWFSFLRPAQITPRESEDGSYEGCLGSLTACLVACMWQACAVP